MPERSPLKLTPEQRALLKKKLQQRNLGSGLDSKILPRNCEQPTPLSYAQEWMWLLNELEGSAYNIPLTLEITGRVDIGCLERCLQALVQRHEVLRTVYRWQGEQIQQVVLSEVALSLAIADLSNLPLPMRAERAQQLLSQETERPFDLTREVPLRAIVVKFSAAEVWLHCTWHHIACDDTSQTIFIKELGSLYQAFSQGLESPLPPLPIQYGDFARWQRQTLTKENLTEALSYWRQHLTDLPQDVSLPSRHSRSQSSDLGQSIQVPFALSPALTAELKALSRRHRVTLFATLLTAFEMLLYRYTGQTDIVVGIPVSDRAAQETQTLIGVFINNLVLRADFSGASRFEDWLERVNATVIDAREHQTLPYPKLVADLNPDRSSQKTGLFQVMFDFQSVALPAIELPDVTFKPSEKVQRLSDLDLVLHIEETSEGLTGYIKSSDRIFKLGTLERAVGHFQTLLLGLVARPQQEVSHLPLLTETERQQLLVEWNNASNNDSPEKCIHALFEEQVQRTPNAIAIIFEGKHLTYAELNQRAEQLAYYLQVLGVEPESPVGLYLDRSIDAIVGVFGILKAGGAYVPISPDYPQERLNWMLKDARVSILVARSTSNPNRDDPSLQIVNLDTDWEAISQCHCDRPQSPVAPHHLAYIIYTSGSTGHPKGVAVEHRHIFNYCISIAERLNVEVGDRLAMVQPLTFDSCLTMLFSALTRGGTLHMFGQETAVDTAALAEYFQYHSIDYVKITPSHLSTLQAEGEIAHLLPGKCLVLGGEPSRWDWLLDLKNIAPHCSIVNHYGPTETTVGAIIYELDTEDSNFQHVTAPIGRPLPHTEAYILDRFLQPVPIGVAGELYVGGAGVSRGYLNRPELTAETFVPNPFGEGRLYKTGDLVRYQSNGNLEFLGRSDRQIKVRGFRIELGEIEATLAQISGIKTSAVIVRDDRATGDKRLVAYIIPSPGTEVRIAAIRRTLTATLPNYMVPSAFVVLDALPLTSSGKVDIRSLPAPNAQSRELAEKEAPKTPTEKQLAAIWQTALGLDRIGINEYFFELGGHSLLAMQVTTRIHNEFQTDMSLRQFFEHPTIARLAERLDAHGQKSSQEPETSVSLARKIASLNPQQVANLRSRLQQRSSQQAIVPRTQIAHIPEGIRVDIDGRDGWRATSSQTRLWFLDQYLGPNPIYNIVRSLRLYGPLNLEALRAAFQQLILRHEALRTTFHAVDGIPYQVVANDTDFDLTVIDLQDIPKDERELEFQSQLKAWGQHTFDLTRDCLIRAFVYCLGENEFGLQVVIHHIVADGWSFGILSRELSVFYRDFLSDNDSSSLPPLSLHFIDYSLWFQHQLASGLRDRDRHYWQTQLGRELPILELPSDRPRSREQTYQGNRVSILFLPELTSDLKALATRSEVSLFMVLLASFKVLLHRYTGQPDIIVGSPIANRNQPELEDIWGYFVDTLPLRTDLSGNPSFLTLLNRVRQTALDAYTHAYPFAEILSLIQVSRDVSQSPVFSVVMSLQNTPSSELEFPNISFATCDRHRTTAIGAELKAKTPLGSYRYSQDIEISRFDLTALLKEEDGQISGILEYNRDLFDADRIDRLIGHWQVLLRGIVDAPHRPIARLPLLTDAERHLLLLQRNASIATHPSNQCIHEVFEDCVRSTPKAVALTCQEQQLTYQELNQRANQLAHHLQTLGAQPESLVGICVERSLDTFVAVLAVWKSGGAYVPLDPAYGRDRLDYMLCDAGVAIVLTTTTQRDRFTDFSGKVVNLDCLEWDGLSTQNPTRCVRPENLAYVIYTSGSTGRPKGVLIIHQGVCNLHVAQRQRFALPPHSRVVQFASLSFDASVWEMVMAWGAGATLCLGTREELMPGRNLQQFLQTQHVTHATLPPSALNTLCSAELPELQVAIVAGEACSPQLMNIWGQKRSLFNAYGPTEVTVCATVHHWTPEDPVVSIGSAIANTQTCILDAHLQPVPVGIPGELHVGGLGLARGYLNRSELTEMKFIPNPFGAGRLYKTGDLARYLPNGNIEFLGRLDRQVKMRGFRIELGEIEAHLTEMPEVEASVVTDREGVPGDKRLVGYVIPKSGARIAVADLRNHLKTKLPDYMVPNGFVLLETFPLTPNGKIDYKALPAPQMQGISKTFKVPQTERQRGIAALFAEVLLLTSDLVGLDDNFFELGGHSLLATQLASRLRSTFDVELSIQTLFEAPTVADLDAVLATELTPVGVPAIAHVPREASSIRLSYAQERLWFLAQLEGYSATYNIPRAVRHTGNLDLDVLQQAVDELIRRHEILRTTFPTTAAGGAVQQIAPTLHIPVETSTLTGPLSDWLAREAAQPFDLATGPLLRVKLVHLEDEAQVLSVTMHHIISDGWSIGIFFDELAALYEAFRGGNPSPLPPLPVQYVDYTLWQRQWLQGEMLDTQLSYWKHQLAGIPACLELPSDRPRPAVQTFRGGKYEMTLSRSLSLQVKTLARTEAVTPFMTLLAAFQILLYRYSAQQDIAVGTPIANRQQTELESLIGFFVNTLVLRIKLDNNDTVADVLKKVRSVALDAYSHQDVPFEQVVEALQPERCLAHSPLFQVMFVLQNAPTASLNLAGGQATPLVSDTQTAKFDLTLSMRDTEQGLVGRWEYNSDLFDSDTIIRMAGHFEILLQGVVADATQSVATLALLSRAERQRLLVEWNDTTMAYPRHKCIHELFAEQVQRTPNAIALTCAGHDLTYVELEQRANQLAHYLRSRGVRTETPVGICLARSLDLAIAILAILKAGGAYVPLDLSYPQERLAFMAAEADIHLLMTHSTHASKLDFYTRDVLLLDTLASRLSEMPAQTAPSSQTTATHLAYVNFTSGSTGTPKGVGVLHRGVTRLVINPNYVTLSDRDVFLQLAPVSFDAATFEIWGALLNGAKLVMYPDTLPTPDALAAVLQRERVSVLWLTAGLFHLMMERSPEALSSVKQLLAGGDVLNPRHVWKARQMFPQNTFINGYGPTENTTFTCCYSVPADIDLERSIPIGRPISGTQVYVLDRALTPVPIGVAGELYIGGDGLAWGYLNQPDLTARRWISNPFISGEKLYKTGDRVRYLSDGNIEFLGRFDHQVKIRGFRVELGEIEHALAQISELETTLTVVREDKSNRKYIVTYAIPKPKNKVEIANIRDRLKEKLPAYAIPSAFVCLDRFPLIPNGKINREALPVPEIQQNSAVTVEPRNDLERKLVRIWKSCLHVNSIGIEDDFFDLGGHSLLAVELLAEMNQQAHVKLSINQFLELPTIAAIAESLTHHTTSTKAPCIVPLKPGNVETPLFLIHAIGSSILFYKPLIEHVQTERAIYGIQSVFLKSPQANIDSLEELAACYVRQIKEIQPQGPYAIGGASFGGLVAYEVARQFTRQDDAVDILMLFDRPAPGGYKTAGVRRRYQHHWQKLISNGPNYLATKLKERLSFELNRAMATFENRQSDLYEKLALPTKRYLGQEIVDRQTKLADKYVPSPYPGEVILIRAEEGRDDGTMYEEDLGWSQYARGGVRVWTNPGKHMSIFNTPNVELLAKRIDSIL